MLEGRTALVTGAGRGIGRGIALALAAAGADVAVNYRRDADAAEEVVGRIRALGRRAVAVQASVTDPAEIERLCATVSAELGPVDLLVANAGIASRGHSVLDSSPEEFELLMATHAFGTVRLAQSLLPAMRERPRADIVVISSSEVAFMRPNCAPYNAAKAALEAVALTLAKEEVANGVRVNIVAPGLVDTDMGRRLVRAALGKEEVAELDAEQPLGRVCRPEDVGAVVRFLVSGEGEMVTGQRIVVDGGATSPTVAHERAAA
jgi:3-oxoacyl-[acyl-carrier protein] reductase